MSEPLLSVCLITYNHAKYIKEAIEGVLMQKVNFSWELIIADDFSTDGTREILLEYKKKHSDFIKLILQEKNIGPAKNWMDLLSYPKSKYIAYFEGDDYWTDPYKLQKQVDFLEANSDFSLCFHNSEVIFSNSKKTQLFNQLQTREYSLNEIVYEWIIPTASVVFRKSAYNQEKINNPNYLYGDIILFISVGENGRIWCINEVMSVYRKHESSLTSNINNTIKLQKKIIKHHEEIRRNFDEKFKAEEDILICNNYILLSSMELRHFKIAFLYSLYRAFKQKPKLFGKLLFANYRNLFLLVINKLKSKFQLVKYNK